MTDPQPTGTTPDASATSTTDKDPAPVGGIAGIVTAAVLFAAARFALPIDVDTATLIGGLLATIGGPLVATLVIRAKAWSPATVAALQAGWKSLAQELADKGTPTVVTGGALQPEEARKLHPGDLGDAEPRTERIGTEDGRPGRHISYDDQDRQEGTR